MKKLFQYIAFFMAAFTLASCSDFLEKNSPSEQTDDNVWNSVFYTGLRVNKLYGDMGRDETYSQYIPIVWGLNSDCELVDALGPSNTANSTREYGNMNYNADASWVNISKLWDAMYAIIEDANLNIQGIRNGSIYNGEESSDKTAMKRYLGESLTIRAMIYADLIRFFGDIPMKFEPSKPDLSNVYLGKTDRDEIMDKLIEDLEEAVELLPWAGETSTYTTEHVTKGYAHALLAQIALTRAGYAIRETSKSGQGYETATYSDPTYPTQRPGYAERQELYELALRHLSAVITSGRHNLNPSVEDQWSKINSRTLDQTYRENMFEIPMGLDVSGELGYTIGVRVNGATSLFGAKGNSTGKMKLTAPFMFSYDENDMRRDITCSMTQLKNVTTEKGDTVQEQMLANVPFEIYVGKWDIFKMNKEWRETVLNKGDNKTLTGINVVRMRYPQVLLWYAEVMNELAGPDGRYEGDAGMSARQALALVHTRAFSEANMASAENYIAAIPANKDDFFEAIVQENAWELAGEGFRKFDLIRWNLLAQKTMDMQQQYLDDLSNGVYPEKIYYNKYLYTNAETGVSMWRIDKNSITWYGIPAGKSASDYKENSKSFGSSKPTDASDKQIYTNLLYISCGLVGVGSTDGYTINHQQPAVINRYLLPLHTNTISLSNGMLQNSYGY